MNRYLALSLLMLLGLTLPLLDGWAQEPPPAYEVPGGEPDHKQFHAARAPIDGTDLCTNVGKDSFYDTSKAPAETHYCSAPNTWLPVGSSGGGGVGDAIHVAGNGDPNTGSVTCAGVDKDRYLDLVSNIEWFCSAVDMWTQTLALKDTSPSVDHTGFDAEVLALADVKSGLGDGDTAAGMSVCFSDTDGKLVTSCTSPKAAIMRGETSATIVLPPIGDVVFDVSTYYGPSFPDDMELIAGGIIQINVDGLYSIQGSVGFVPATDNDCRNWRWLKNESTQSVPISNYGYGGNMKTGGQSSIASFQSLASGFEYLVAGDELTLNATACPDFTLDFAGDYAPSGTSFVISRVVEDTGGGGGGGSPAGPDQSVQINVGGTFDYVSGVTATDAPSALRAGAGEEARIAGGDGGAHLGFDNDADFTVLSSGIDPNGDNPYIKANDQTDLTISNVGSGIVKVEDISFAGDYSIQVQPQGQVQFRILNNNGGVTIQDIDIFGNESIRLPTSAAKPTLTISNDFAFGDVNVEGIVHSNNSLVVPGRLDVLSATTLSVPTTIGAFIFDDDLQGGGSPKLFTVGAANIGANGVPLSTWHCLTAAQFGNLAYAKTGVSGDTRSGIFICGDDLSNPWVELSPAPVTLQVVGSLASEGPWPEGTPTSVNITESGQFGYPHYLNGPTKGTPPIWEIVPNTDLTGADAVGDRYVFNGAGANRTYLAQAACSISTDSPDLTTRTLHIIPIANPAVGARFSAQATGAGAANEVSVMGLLAWKFNAAQKLEFRVSSTTVAGGGPDQTVDAKCLITITEQVGRKD